MNISFIYFFSLSLFPFLPCLSTLFPSHLALRTPETPNMSGNCEARNSRFMSNVPILFFKRLADWIYEYSLTLNVFLFVCVFCVYSCVWLFVFLYICLFVYMFIHWCSCLCFCMFVFCLCLRIYICLLMYVYTCLLVCMSLSTCVCVCS